MEVGGQPRRQLLLLKICQFVSSRAFAAPSAGGSPVPMLVGWDKV